MSGVPRREGSARASTAIRAMSAARVRSIQREQLKPPVQYKHELPLE
jgi:hypothetical protein